MASKKIIHYSCENGIEQSVPGEHCLSSLAKFSGRIFLYHPHNHHIFLNTVMMSDTVFYVPLLRRLVCALPLYHKLVCGL